MTISFKQFLKESKQQLLKAADAAPVHVRRYRVIKYNTLTTEGNLAVQVRPKYQIIVEWVYEDPTQPRPQSIKVIGPDMAPQTYTPSVDSQKLTRWLNRNTKEEVFILKGIRHG